MLQVNIYWPVKRGESFDMVQKKSPGLFLRTDFFNIYMG